jgi:hypothetical protein
MTDWKALLGDGDYTGARAACKERFAGRADDPESSWELAEVEERWGDALFFAGESGAAEHYHAAQAALVPQGVQFTSLEENDRRMSAYQRVANKLYAMDPYGRPRPGHDGRPHPNSSRVRPRAKDTFDPSEPSIEEQPSPVLELRETTPMEQSEYARLFQNSEHWHHYDLGNSWREAGNALAGWYPEGARRAYSWSIHYFELYGKAWTAHLPASRWDSDGYEEAIEVQNLTNSLVANPSEPTVPAWMRALLAGDWQRALVTAGDAPPAPEWRCLTMLLVGACQAAGRDDAGRRLMESQGLEPADPL